jgi:hypothetical protein
LHEAHYVPRRRDVLGRRRVYLVELNRALALRCLGFRLRRFAFAVAVVARLFRDLTQARARRKEHIKARAFR